MGSWSGDCSPDGTVTELSRGIPVLSFFLGKTNETTWDK